MYKVDLTKTKNDLLYKKYKESLYLSVGTFLQVIDLHTVYVLVFISTRLLSLCLRESFTDHDYLYAIYWKYLSEMQLSIIDFV